MQVDHSSGFSAYLPSFLPALWQKPSPILEIALDSHRHILYTRSQRSSIEVKESVIEHGCPTFLNAMLLVQKMAVYMPERCLMQVSALCAVLCGKLAM